MASLQTRGALRRRIRDQRRLISPKDALDAAAAVARHASKLELFRMARRIAAYKAIQGELDPQPLVKIAWTQGKAVYLPVLGGPECALQFYRYRPDTPLIPNRLGIPEPQASSGDAIAPDDLDLVLAPLVAFDSTGNRIGMGGGHYDRTFAFLRANDSPAHPVLLGLAFEMQHVASLPASSWDVPLAGVVTEKRLHAARSED